MSKTKKVAACAMAFTMALSAVAATGCNKKSGKKGETVSADATWYDMTKCELTLDYDRSAYDYLQGTSLGKVGDYFAILVDGNLAMPSDVPMEDINYSDYAVTNIELFDEDGNHVKTINVTEAISNSGVFDEVQPILDESLSGFDPFSMEEDFDEIEEEVVEDESEEEESDEVSDEEEADIEVEEDYELPEDMEFEDEDFGLDASENYYVGDVIAKGDVLSVGVHFYSFSGDDIVYNFCIDPATEEATYSLTTEDTRPQGGSEGIVHVGDYDVDPYWVYDGGYYIISVSDANGVVCEVDLQEALPDEDIFWVRGVMLIDDSNLLVSYTSNGSYGGSFFTLNLSNGAVEAVEGDDYEFLNQYAEANIAYFDGIGNVIIDTDGIKAVNFDSKELEEVFSWDSCNVNRSDITEMELISYSEDEIVFMGAAYRIGSGMSMVQLNDQQIITLTKADSNPNAGKTILTAASTGYIDYAMSEAVCIFNESNPDFFIRFDTKYEVKPDAYDYSDDQAMQESVDNASIELGNQLTVDIMSGEGPDIIFDTASLSQLNNDDYLVDLSDRINTDGLFGNVIEAAKVDGKLYQIPLAFGACGIITLQDNVEAGQVGFTFDQYADFVSGPCNGTNPIQKDQTDFFILCMDAMGEQFITEDGKVDYDNEAFRSLAEYVNENVTAPIDGGDEDYYMMSSVSLSDEGAIAFEYGSFLYLVEAIGAEANDAVVLGLPSVDGRGAMISVDCSVAISAQAVDIDGCWSFVETLTSTQIQEYYADSSIGTPINIAAYESSAQHAVDSYNELVDYYARIASPMELAMYGLPSERVDSSIIERYKDMVASCSSVSTTDPAVSAIIREEMPAYFSGQKTLDDVISTIENRVQTFLDERG